MKVEPLNMNAVEEAKNEGEATVRNGSGHDRVKSFHNLLGSAGRSASFEDPSISGFIMHNVVDGDNARPLQRPACLLHYDYD